METSRKSTPQAARLDTESATKSATDDRPTIGQDDPNAHEQSDRVARGGSFTPDGHLILEWDDGTSVQYRPGSKTLGSGSYGSVQQYKRVTDAPDLPQTLAIKTFFTDSAWLQQEAAVQLVTRNPELREYVVDALAIDSRIVMPSMHGVEALDPLQVWRQARDAVVALHRLGLAYFDLKMANLLSDHQRVFLADIGGLSRPDRHPDEKTNTYAYPGHGGRVWVTKDTIRTIEPLVSQFALIALGLQLLHRISHLDCNPSELSFTAVEKYNFDLGKTVGALRVKIARTLLKVPEWNEALEMPSDDVIRDSILSLEVHQIAWFKQDDWNRMEKILVWCDPGHASGDVTKEFQAKIKW